jgi:hypothetical protein
MVIKMISILMSILILLSNSGIVLAVHHCHIAEVTSISLFQELGDECHVTDNAIHPQEPEPDNCCKSQDAPLEIPKAIDLSDCGFIGDIPLDSEEHNPCCEQKALEFDADLEAAVLLLKETTADLSFHQYTPTLLGSIFSYTDSYHKSHAIWLSEISNTDPPYLNSGIDVYLISHKHFYPTADEDDIDTV